MNELFNDGDLDGSAVSCRIIAAIEEAERLVPTRVERVN